MRIETRRFLLHDFDETDRSAFLTYQLDPRYRALYDRGTADAGNANDLFDRFVAWQRERPRLNFQVGVFERANERLIGCAGLRRAGKPDGVAVVGLELAPDQWGRHGAALEIADALIDHGFRAFGLETLVGETASGNARVERLARRFGATVGARRGGSDWMKARGWEEIDWVLHRAAWSATTGARDATSLRQRPNGKD